MGFPEDSSGHVDVSPLVSVCPVRRRADLYLRRNFRAHIKSAPAIAYTQPLLKIAIETRVQYKVGFAGQPKIRPLRLLARIQMLNARLH